MAKKDETTIPYLLSMLAQSTARSPATAAAANATMANVQGVQSAKYAQAKKKAEKKQKKAGKFSDIGGTLGSIIGTALPVPGGTYIGEALGSAAGAQLGGADENVLESLGGAGLEAGAHYGLSQVAGSLGKVAAKTSKTKVPGAEGAKPSGVQKSTTTPGAQKQPGISKTAASAKGDFKTELFTTLAKQVDTVGAEQLIKQFAFTPTVKDPEPSFGMSGQSVAEVDQQFAERAQGERDELARREDRASQERRFQAQQGLAEGRFGLAEEGLKMDKAGVAYEQGRDVVSDQQKAIDRGIAAEKEEYERGVTEEEMKARKNRDVSLATHRTNMYGLAREDARSSEAQRVFQNQMTIVREMRDYVSALNRRKETGGVSPPTAAEATERINKLKEKFPDPADENFTTLVQQLYKGYISNGYTEAANKVKQLEQEVFQPSSATSALGTQTTRFNKDWGLEVIE